MTNMAAAMGVAQLEQLQKHVVLKRTIAARYEEAFQSISEITAHPEPAHCNSTYWMYTVRLNQVARPVIDRLNLEGILSRPLWAPLPRLPMYADCYCYGSLLHLDQLYKQTLSLPCSVSLSHTDQKRVIETLLEALDIRRDNELFNC
jgi:perosamine synthetase